MKTIGSALIATIVVFFTSILIIAPIISKIGYSAVEGSYHAVTHALLVSVIFIIIVATIIISDSISESININKELNNNIQSNNKPLEND